MTARVSRLLRASTAFLAAGALAACGAPEAYVGQPEPGDRGMRIDGDVITRAQITEINPATMEELFDGHVAGVDVQMIGGLKRLVIRGNADPLIVVDDVPLPDSQEFWSLEPHEIERIEILKDEAAAARYGALGSRGAVVISTFR